MTPLTVHREMVRKEQLRSLDGHIGKLPDAAFDFRLRISCFAIDDAGREQLDVLRQQWEFSPHKHFPAATAEVFLSLLHKIDPGEAPVHGIVGPRALSAYAGI